MFARQLPMPELDKQLLVFVLFSFLVFLTGCSDDNQAPSRAEEKTETTDEILDAFYCYSLAEDFTSAEKTREKFKTMMRSMAKQRCAENLVELYVCTAENQLYAEQRECEKPEPVPGEAEILQCVEDVAETMKTYLPRVKQKINQAGPLDLAHFQQHCGE